MSKGKIAEIGSTSSSSNGKKRSRGQTTTTKRRRVPIEHEVDDDEERVTIRVDGGEKNVNEALLDIFEQTIQNKQVTKLKKTCLFFSFK